MEMVRYSHSDNTRKDCLYTIRDDSNEIIFFGISRCNIFAGDKFKKDLAVKIAKGRAQKAKEVAHTINDSPPNLDISTEIEFYPMGWINKGDIKKLLQYFDNLSYNLDPKNRFKALANFKKK